MSRDAGFTTVQWVVMIAIAMVVLTMVANLVAVQYAMGAAQSAVDRGARAGAALDGSPGRCVASAVHTLQGPGGLLTGRLGKTVRVECARSGSQVIARGIGVFEWWVAPFPPLHLTVEGRSVVEPQP